MAEGHRELKVNQLLLDTENPRMDPVQGQPAAMQAVVTDQGQKLATLAKSIAERGLNPAERLLVVGSGTRYVVVEGNRRIMALKILHNPDLLGGLDMPMPLRKRLMLIAEDFDAKRIGKVACYEYGSREEAKHWIQLRHTGENNGEGIVNWTLKSGHVFPTPDYTAAFPEETDVSGIHAELQVRGQGSERS